MLRLTACVESGSEPEVCTLLSVIYTGGGKAGVSPGPVSAVDMGSVYELGG